LTLSHICLGTNDPPRTERFYDALLATLGHSRCAGAEDTQSQAWRGWIVYRGARSEELTLWLCRPFDGQAATAGNGTMVAFRARSWSEVERFHAAALAHGGTSEGAPGLRPQYGADFYVAYVRDPDGNKLAAYCRGFTQSQAKADIRRAHSALK
jgi:catechol 2,3-dioxygenase-like lactoylglutathione lyase family enzyme